MKARTKFLVGGLLVLGPVGYLMASSIKQTGVYYLDEAGRGLHVPGRRSESRRASRAWLHSARSGRS